MRVVTIGGLGQFHETEQAMQRLIAVAVLGTLALGVGGYFFWRLSR